MQPRPVLLLQGRTTVGPDRTELTFTAPPPGHYLFRDELHSSKPAELVTVAPGRTIPAWASWVPGLRTALDALLDEEREQYLDKG